MDCSGSRHAVEPSSTVRDETAATCRSRPIDPIRRRRARGAQLGPLRVTHSVCSMMSVCSSSQSSAIPSSTKVVSPVATSTTKTLSLSVARLV
jgi:hypothetical protein